MKKKKKMKIERQRGEIKKVNEGGKRVIAKRERGITLIALVVTIIIMLILAAVTLNMALGDNGLIQMAKFASNKYEQAAINESIAMNALADRLNNPGSVAPSTTTTPTPTTTTPSPSETTPSPGDTEGSPITDVKLGDKWENVQFKDLSVLAPSGANNAMPADYVQAYFIKETVGNGFWVILLGNFTLSAATNSNPVILLGWGSNITEMTSEGATFICGYSFNGSEALGATEKYENTEWLRDTTADSYGTYPFSGEVVGIISNSQYTVSENNGGSLKSSIQEKYSDKYTENNSITCTQGICECLTGTVSRPTYN